ncbi:MAG: nucleotide exchange factor GrpE [Eubacteriales bacterium]
MTKKEKVLADIKIEDNDSSANEDTAKLEKKIKKLEKKLKEAQEAADKLAKEKEDYIGYLQKERAEFDNFRKRSQTQSQQSFSSGVEDTVTKLLPVLDSINLALAHAPEEESDFVKGIVNLQKLFTDTLASMDVHEIESDGVPFNHDMHHALMQIDCEEGEEPGTVKQVFKKGYIKGEKVLRYAEVIVTK